MNRVRTILQKVTRKPVRIGIYSVALAAVPLGIHEGWWDPEAAALALPMLLALLYLSPDDVD